MADKNNPWGNNKGNKGGKKPSKPTNINDARNKRGQEPDLDELLKKAQNNLNDMLPGGFGGGVIGVAMGAVLLVLFVTLCTYIVKPGEQAVVQQFGAWERTKSQEGLSFKLPWPIETVTKVNVNELRRMNIGFIEGFSRGGNQVRDIAEESLMLTSDRNIVDIDLVIQWNIKSAEDYLFNIKDQEATIKKVAESAIREQVGKTNMFPIITTDRNEVAVQAREIIQNNLDEYNSGVNITGVLIQTAEVHPDVQQAFQDVQSAKQDAEDTQNRARAYREDILPKARGAAAQLMQQAQAYEESTVAKSTGDADRFNSIYQAYLSGQDVTKKRIYLETMEEVLSNAQKIILDSNGKGSGVVPYLPLNELKPASGNTTRRNVE